MSRVFSRNLIPRYTLVGDRYYICFYTCPFKDGKNWYICVYALPKWTGGKEPTCRCRKHKRSEFKPWVGEIPWRRSWKSNLVFLPGESHGQRSLVGYSPWGRKESDTTQQLTLLLSPSYRIISVSSFLLSDWRLLTWSPWNRWTSFAKLYYYVRASLSPLTDLGGLEGKASACDAEDPGSIPGLRRSPG